MEYTHANIISVNSKPMSASCAYVLRSYGLLRFCKKRKDLVQITGAVKWLNEVKRKCIDFNVDTSDAFESAFARWWVRAQQSLHDAFITLFIFYGVVLSSARWLIRLMLLKCTDSDAAERIREPTKSQSHAVQLTSYKSIFHHFHRRPFAASRRQL